MANKLRLTTDHPASSYGVPVMVDAQGNAYGPRDVVPGTGVMAVWLANGFDADLERKFIAAANLRPEECAPVCAEDAELPVCPNCGKRHSDLLSCETAR